LLAGCALQQAILWWRAPASAGTGATPTQPAIQAWLVVGDAAHSLGSSNLPLSTLNPSGQLNTVPLWQDFVSEGARVTSPHLRLQGTKGRETLVVTVTPHKGLPQCLTLHLWHV